ncbi:UTRA domain-containing protein [Streptomyces sp. SID8361]|nr:UTRA domain-containing protein [Streptomyces sp. SID8361]SCG10672.1 GntR family transcriptional regulator [Streptomyces sp. MnatMP-M27]
MASMAINPHGNSAGVARYNQLAMIFRRRIDSGHWAVGERIPTVVELAEEWRVAPATVRQALGLLEDAGLIERFRAKGTFVRRRPQQDLWCEVPTDWNGLLLSPPGIDVELLSSDADARPPHIEHTVGTPAASYRHWRRRHSRDGRPYYLGDAYIAERWAARITDEQLTQNTTLRILKDIPGLHLAAVHQTLTIVTADVELSSDLDVPLNSPIARVLRTAVDADGIVVFVGDGMYRGDIVRLDISVSA